MANLNKDGLRAESSATFQNNTIGLITPVLHRAYNSDTIDSFLTSKDPSNLEAVIRENISASIASGSTVNLAIADGNLVHITGTNTILSFGNVQAGARFVLVFDDILRLTYNATSLILPSSADIDTNLNDTAFLISEGSGNWRCVAYQRSDGTALIGGTGGGTWGSITGTLSAQTDLQAALEEKVNANIPITGGTGIKITYDEKGLVLSSAGATLNDLTGVTISSPADDQVLTYDSTTSQWINQAQTAATPLGYFGQAFDYNIQTAVTNNIGVPIIFGTSDLSNGISVVSNGTALTRIFFANSGIYNLQFSVQIQNLANAPEDVHIWLRLNGADIVGSTGVVGMQSRKSTGVASHTITGWNYLLDVTGGQFYELIWSTTNVANVDLRFYASTVNHPSTASTLFTVTQQSGIMAGTGLTSLNGLTADVQVFTTGEDSVLGDWWIDSIGDTHVFNIPSASELSRGLLTAADWVTFDSKYDNPTGTTSQYIRGNGTFAALPCEIQTAVSDETTTLTTGTSKMTFRMPYAMTVTSVRASVNTAPTGSAITVDVKENGTSIMTTTKISIPAGTKTSVGSGTPVLTDTALADDSEISIDILTVGSTLGGAGLKVTIIGTRA